MGRVRSPTSSPPISDSRSGRTGVYELMVVDDALRDPHATLFHASVALRAVPGVQRVLKADVSGSNAPSEARKGATP